MIFIFNTESIRNMLDDEKIVINSVDEAREIIQKRADAYEHTVKKASSLLQLIIGMLSVIAALAAAGLLTELTASIFNPDGIDRLTTKEILWSLAAFFVLLLIVISGLITMVTHLVSILLKSKYPGVISPDKPINFQGITDLSDNNDNDDDKKDKIQYSTWLIRYVCDRTDMESPLNIVQRDYRVAVYSGVGSTILFLISIILVSYLFEGSRGGLLFGNIFVIILSLIAIIGYYIFNEYIQLTQDVSGGSILIVDILLIISAISSGIAAYYSIVELYVQYSPIL